MDEVEVSKLLAYVLRHEPAAAGVTLDAAGWVDVEELLAGLGLDRATLERVVATNPKRRYELRDGRIRAVQGHSVPVELGLEPLEPPPVLYHGTVERVLPAILREGLRPMGRTHVHLSADVGTARAVGARRGRPVVLRVDTAGLRQPFYRAANGVWLTAAVPPERLSRV